MILIAVISPLFSLDVAEEEIKIPDTGQIVFENYSGPYTVVKTLDEIFGIGKELGTQEGSERQAENGQFRVIRAIDPESEEGFDADILILGPEGYVDHITNVRRILAGYLEDAYGYTREDALLLAKFITFYNAVHRGDREMVVQRYKRVVLDNLETDKIGIARSYRDWPGKTMMLIPLTGQAEEGGLGSLDSDELSDDQVVEDLREEDDKGVEDRKDLVDLKEREIDEEEKAIEEERRQIEEEERRIADDDTGDAGTEETADGAADDREKSGGDTGTGDGEESGDTGGSGEDDRTLEERRQDLEEREEALDERRQNLEEEREEIAEDQQLVIAAEERKEGEGEEEEPAAEGRIFLLTREDGYSQLALVDFTTGNYIAKSSVAGILGRTFIPLSDSYLVVFQEGNSAGAALGTIGRDSLELQTQSSESVYADTYVLLDGASIYAVVDRKGEWKLGRFNSSLQLQAESSSTVAPYSLFIVEGDYIYIQTGENTLKAFDKSTLE